MIKQLLSVLAVASAVTVNAQSSGRVVSQTINFANEPEYTKSITYKTAVLGCDTLTTAQNTSLQINTAGSDTSTPGCSPKAGYVFGSNCYGDLQKANYFPTSLYSSISSPSIAGVLVGFYRDVTGGKGTQGAGTTTVGMNIYNATSGTGGGPSGSAISSTVATMTQISAATGTSVITYYTFTLSTPVAPGANGFYASVKVPTTAGDTAVVFNSPSSTTDYGYEQWNDNTWHSISSAWGASLKANLSIYPIVCGNIITGISKSTIEKNVSLLPNPSTGLVNVLLTFGNAENVSVTVTNALGQQILSNKYEGVTSFVAPIDLSNNANGIYFVTVSNGTEKVVQRLIINK